MEEEIKKLIREEIAAAAHTNGTSDEILDTREAAAFLKIQRSTVYELKARNKIPFKQVGGKIVFFKSELIEWVKSGAAAQ